MQYSSRALTCSSHSALMLLAPRMAYSSSSSILLRISPVRSVVMAPLALKLVLHWMASILQSTMTPSLLMVTA